MKMRTNKPARIALYRGRWWAAAMLLLLAPLCFVAGLTPLLLPNVWIGMSLMGLPALFGAWLCAVSGWGEAIARVEIREDGFSLRLPRYRGYLPRSSAQRLAVTWPEVTRIRRTTVRGVAAIFRFDYVAWRIETKRGSAFLIEPLPNVLSASSKGVTFNIPAGEVASLIVQHSGREPEDGDTVRGGGMLRNIFFGGPRGT